VLVLVASTVGLRAQGGPPMITDDPGTPGDGHVEINLAWTTQRMAQSSIQGAPLLDADYGIGERLQLNYQASWSLFRGAAGQDESGPSDSQVALKWRYYDAGPSGLQLSTFPRITFPNPGSGQGRGEIDDSHGSFLLPLEARRDLGLVSVNADFGHVFSSSAADRGWLGGLCVGRELTRGWELDLEVHLEESERMDRGEAILNAGTRWDVSEHATLFLAVGRDVRNTLGPRISTLCYAGIQLRL
jgi:hypothetical protein